MHENTIQLTQTEFAKEIKEGLTAFPKYLSSKYFYDEKGDALFQKIMALPEYYLTNCEFEILSTYTKHLAELFSKDDSTFSLFELGAGDGKKTKILLKYLIDNNYNFDYRPIDISSNALSQLKSSINKEIPSVVVNPIQGTYFDTLKTIKDEQQNRKVILFLGSNIGNLLHKNAIAFLHQLRAAMHKKDLLLMGMDLKKNPQTVLDAYNDPTGVTAAFNKNILNRINSELGAKFDVEKFKHWEVYDPETGTAKSYLVSTCKQSIFIEELETVIEFEAWETIHTEISQKYDDQTVDWLAKASGFKVIADFCDSQSYFKNYIFQPL
ncbi:dimethylhistidine N-methyltransferase [Croceivirga lutea]|uniref:L-histidine N(alpha)-methyltransferase n=1 Tax=Croceivirga lutea TaxID=1775167 RepID=UPI00163AF847|nr:L-histidine N(alpha)-methyltransferase [Croceivirga lutea]GGG53907.1 dimethylhistidine N-methyltransferase [Croceivirga lutea]